MAGEAAGHGGKKKNREMKQFKCPVYKYPIRNDINWVFDCELNCEEEVHHWIMRGCCLLCSID